MFDYYYCPINRIHSIDVRSLRPGLEQNALPALAVTAPTSLEGALTTASELAHSYFLVGQRQENAREGRLGLSRLTSGLRAGIALVCIIYTLSYSYGNLSFFKQRKYKK